MFRWVYHSFPTTVMARQRVFALIAEEKRRRKTTNMARMWQADKKRLEEKKRNREQRDREESHKHRSSDYNHPRNETHKRGVMSEHGGSECPVIVVTRNRGVLS